MCRCSVPARHAEDLHPAEKLKVGIWNRARYCGFVENETRALEQHPAGCALLEIDRDPGWTPGPPYSDQVLSWRTPRVALWLPPAVSRR